MNVAVVSYGLGNLASVQKAVETVGHSATAIDDSAHLEKYDRIIMPGIGTFAEGIDRLQAGGWTEAIRRQVNAGKPLLGICLGMQLLADRGNEAGERRGLALIPGEIADLRSIGCSERVPHVGWNEARACRTDPLFDGLPDICDFYFTHSYAFQPIQAEDICATAEYGCRFAAVVRNGRAWGTQFHPEKSNNAGLRLLRNFIELGEC